MTDNKKKKPPIGRMTPTGVETFEFSRPFVHDHPERKQAAHVGYASKKLQTFDPHFGEVMVASLKVALHFMLSF